MDEIDEGANEGSAQIELNQNRIELEPLMPLNEQNSWALLYDGIGLQQTMYNPNDANMCIQICNLEQ